MLRTASLLCASLLLAPAEAWARDLAPFVTQLQLPARGAARDAFAWRDGAEVVVARADLSRLGIVAPGSDERVPLSAVPGLSYRIDEGASAIVISCTAECFEVQRLSAPAITSRNVITESARGAYVNYDVETQWADGDGVAGSGVAEASLFGRWGLIESSWLGAEIGLARLETRWTIDSPSRGLRVRLGDSSMVGAGGAPVRFGGVQIGRHFGLTPSLITYPTPTLAGEAATASTVELYVDGALQARERVQAGPFAFDDTPLINGQGEAQLVVTDVAGRQQVITRPFLVSTSLLRPGLTDWALSAGAVRRDYGRRSAAYGESFLAGRYRAGITSSLTAEAAFDLADDATTIQTGATFANIAIGQLRVAHTEGAKGGATEASWLRSGPVWSFGLQGEVRDPAFRALGRDEDTLRRGFAANASVNLGGFGSASLAAGSIESSDEPRASTLAFAYSPHFDFGSLSVRVLYTEREDRELAFGLTFSLALNEGVNSTFGYDTDNDGATYRASAQRAPGYAGGFGWRARSAAGARQRLEYSGLWRSDWGDSTVQFARTRDRAGVRAQHAGSIGVIDGHAFAAQPIRGAFALVDADAANVGVSRDRLRIGATGRDGRVLATGLRPYESNVIAIAADDLPFDRAPSSTEWRVTPAEGAGVVVRFEDAVERLAETRVRFANGEAPPRGSVLVRLRDRARLPVGTDGRLVVLGAQPGDVVELSDDARCRAAADDAALASGLTLICAVAS